MSGDYSRKRFNPENHYQGVLRQQGRVDLDADWNEYVDLQDRHWRAESIDVIGRCGVPSETPDGFKIRKSGNQSHHRPGSAFTSTACSPKITAPIGSSIPRWKKTMAPRRFR